MFFFIRVFAPFVSLGENWELLLTATWISLEFNLCFYVSLRRRQLKKWRRDERLSLGTKLIPRYPRLARNFYKAFIFHYSFFTCM